eukprot:4500283-Pyramimonas_sp.AAC.1
MTIILSTYLTCVADGAIGLEDLMVVANLVGCVTGEVHRLDFMSTIITIITIVLSTRLTCVADGAIGLEDLVVVAPLVGLVAEEVHRLELLQEPQAVSLVPALGEHLQEQTNTPPRIRHSWSDQVAVLT